MLTLLFFTFFAGVVTVLSPCILPILPIILSTGTMQGRYRPLGTIIGLMISFSFFTLALTAIVNATGISPNALRYGAIFLIFLFGLIMIVPRLTNLFARITAPIAGAGQKIKPESTGFGGGMILGFALGLLWTPCAGPILASIIVLVATHGITNQALLMTLVYSIGAGIPMLLIAYGGGKIIQSSKFLSRHAEKIRKFFGFLMILVAVALTFHWDMLYQEKITRFIPEITVQPPEPTQQIGGDAPEITGISKWINSPPLTLAELRGKVVLIDFWTYTCINCLRTIPYVEKWYADYKDKGLVIIGVHTPEFEFEKDPQNVAEAVKRLGIEYPVALDNDYQTWLAYHNHYWPAHYLIDQNGNIVETLYGEGGYVKVENSIRKLLGLAPLDMKEPSQSSRTITPETYLGLLRAESYTSDITLQPMATYSYSGSLGKDEVGLKGDWKVNEESITAVGDNAYLDLNFLARRVYLVLAGSSKTPVKVFLDGRAAGEFIVDGDQKYDVVKTNYKRHQLSLKIPPGVSAYVFTFGDE